LRGAVPVEPASATTAILITFAVALIAAAAGAIGIYASFGPEDKEQMRALVRHPLRTIFSEPDERDDDEA
jgi:hypothetical protein